MNVKVDTSVATIRDVAASAGVSPATVSRVMNNPSIVGPEKRQRTLTAVYSLGYAPNRAAQSLKSKRFSTLALLVADIANPFFAETAKVVQEACEERGYALVLCDTDHRPERLVRILLDLPSRAVDGVVVVAGDDLRQPEVRSAFCQLIERGMPVILGTNQMQDLGIHSVTIGHRSGGAAAARHLAERDLLPAVFLGNTTTSLTGRERLRGFHDALEELGHAAGSCAAIETSFSYEGGRAAVQHMVATGRLPRSIFAASDHVALGVMRGLAQAGLRIPNDVAVVGFDDIALAAYCEPPLTTVRVPLAEMGRLAVEALLELIGGGAPPMEQRLSVNLVVRESTDWRPAPAGNGRRSGNGLVAAGRVLTLPGIGAAAEAAPARA
ncbi:MAG: LacI family DNA-binding transcriptional regulator [Chloroflexota bacterium]